VVSDWKKSEGLNGNWVHTAGKWHGDANDKGATSLFLNESPSSWSCIMSV